MTRLWLLFATLMFGCLFLIYRPEGTITFFSGITSPVDTVAYFTYEHIGLIILASLLVWPPTNYRYMYVLYLVLTVADMVIFLVFYRSPMPWNPLKCGIFGVPLLYETWKSLRNT